MYEGYQPPKFNNLMAKEIPKEHIAHFTETCNAVGTYDDYLVKEFFQSLRANAFDWYINLEPNSIDSWERLEQ